MEIETLLKQIATSPSHYYFAATASELRNIYEQIARELKDKAATNITVTDVLPANVQLIDVEGANVTYGNHTIIQWNIPNIYINQVWTASFKIKPLGEGRVQTNIEQLSNVTFMPYGISSFRTVYFPACEMRVERIGEESVELR